MGGDVGAMTRSHAVRNVEAVGPGTEGQTVRILIGAIGDLGYLVRHVSARTGPGSWRSFDDEYSLSEHLRLMGFGEFEVQGALRALASGDRVELASPARPRAAAPVLAVKPE